MAKASSGTQQSPFAYFREKFKENPHLLEKKNNDEILGMYRNDHNLGPDDDIPKRVKDAMANTKSQERKRLKEGGGATTGRGRGRGPGKPRGPVSSSIRGLEKLEEQIDECLHTVRSMGREDMESVVQSLKQARNAVIWKMSPAN
ncbi:MAG: hypothetical protein ACFCD0_06510 [Gemmataceae bacterium]